MSSHEILYVGSGSRRDGAVLSEKTILICGANGKSGKAAAELVLALGGRVLLSDAKAGEPDAFAFARRYAQTGRDVLVDLRGRDDPGLIDEHAPDMLLTAPGVPLSGELFKRARAGEIPVRGESDFAAGILQAKNPAPVLIGITGTDGKSTTTALLAHLIAEATTLTAVPCGNYGLPLSTLALGWEREPADVLVVECSSFQLEPLVDFHPAISMILNLARDHLDRYPDMDAYLRAKVRIVENQTPEDLLLTSDAVLSRLHRLPETIKLKPRVQAPSFVDSGMLSFRGEPLMAFAEYPAAGAHNRMNLIFALAALDDLLERRRAAGGRDALRGRSALAQAIRGFRGLPHRLEHAGRFQDIEYVNDSKATTVQAVLTALQAYRSDADYRVYLLCGGYDKGGDFSVLPFEDGSIRFMACGHAGPLIAQAARRAGVESEIFPDLKIAFKAAQESAELDGKTDSRPAVVLLSPGCASFDAYKSYEQRGEHFKELVRAVQAAGGA